MVAERKAREVTERKEREEAERKERKAAQRKEREEAEKKRAKEEEEKRMKEVETRKKRMHEEETARIKGQEVARRKEQDEVLSQKAFDESNSKLRVETSSRNYDTGVRDVELRSKSQLRTESRNSGDFSNLKQINSSNSATTREVSSSATLDSKQSDYYKYDTISPTFDSRTRNISGDYRDTVEKSLATSQNLMSVVTGSLVQKKEQPKSRP